MKFLNSLRNKNLSKDICVLRVDFDIKDDSNLRLVGELPTIQFLLKRKAKVVILSHRGRPIITQKSKIKSPNYKKFSLRPLSKLLSQKLKQQIHFIDFQLPVIDKFFRDLGERIRKSPGGSIFLLENLRFLPGEAKDDKKLGRYLASLGTFYVNDAFAVNHRNAASLVAITKFLPSYAGLLLEKEIKNLSRIRNFSRHPFIVILGGAKISDKISLIRNLYKRTDYFLVGGGIASTLFWIQGLPIGDSIYEEVKLSPMVISGINKKIILPIDTVIENNSILDIGPQTVLKYADYIKRAKTVVWNGPVGQIEEKKFQKGSLGIRDAILKSKAYSAVGGGETTMLFENERVGKNIFISTGGGAMLEYLAGKKLPGIEALK